jgi:two-component system chemotaxis response regulator CheY
LRRIVLAVDDSRTVRDMLRHVLSEAGAETYLAEDGQVGLETLGRIAPDLIITDINMPRMDGLRFIAAVRADEAFLGVPILVLSTEAGEDAIRRAREAGATGWLLKPLDAARLHRALDLLVA